MTDSSRGRRALCEQCGRLREGVCPETAWTCRECHLEAQATGLLTVVEARTRERDAARQAAGRLLFRYAVGLERDPWREEYPWLREAEDAARTAWEARKMP